MKLKYILVVGLMMCCFLTKAQSVKTIPNPDTTAIGFDGYNAVEYNGSLYTSYLNKFGKRQLAKCTNKVITLINNPDTGSITKDSKFTVFNNKLYFIYDINADDINPNSQYACYDGANISLIANPANCIADYYTTNTTIYKNRMYVSFQLNTTGESVMTKYDGNSYTILNPNLGVYIGWGRKPFIYKNKLCFIGSTYYNSVALIASYNDTSFTISDTTQSINYVSYYNNDFFEYNNNVYATCSVYSINGYVISCLLKYDGTTLKSIFSDTIQGNNLGGNFCTYNNNLFFSKSVQYPTNKKTNLIQYDGNSFVSINNPDTGQGVSEYGDMFEYKGKLFLTYTNTKGKNQLANFNSTNFNIIPNIDTADEGITGIALLNSKLYFGYINKTNNLNIGRYNDTTLILYQNPNTLGTIERWGIPYDNTLYFSYNDGYGKFQVAYLSDTVVAPSGANTISGSIITKNNKAVKSTNIKINGGGTISTQSNLTGNYSFQLTSGNYTLRPTKNNDIAKANGVTSIDVLLTQRHILNTTKLNSAYKLIAADVNGDRNINSVDVLRMRRLILGTDTTFASTIKGNRLWEFVDSAYQFPDTTNPFPFKDSISFTNLTSNKTNQTFIGVKLGDVNYDWNAVVARMSTVNGQQSMGNNLELIASISNEQLAISNNKLVIKIKTSNFKDIAAMQYTLHFDNTKYEFVNLEGFKNLQGFEFNAAQANENGNIAILWTDSKGEYISLEDGFVLFELVLKPKFTVGGLQLNENSKLQTINLSLNNDITNIEAWDKDFNQRNIVLTQQERINDKLETRSDWFSVNPNPTSGIITISIVSKEKKSVVFELTDSYGNNILKHHTELFKGTNQLTINLKSKRNLQKGVYYIKAIGLDSENVKKIIIL